MAQKDFKVVITQQPDRYVKAAAVDETGREIDNYIAPSENMAVLGLKEALEVRYGPKKETSITIDVPDDDEEKVK